MSRPCQNCVYRPVSDDTYGCQLTDPDACKPCQKLAVLGEKIKAMRETIVAMEEERLELKLQMNSNHDTFTKHLPLEVTMKIFKFILPENIVDLSLETSLSRYTLAAPLVLSAVSRRWRSIVHSMPQLWADLPLRITSDNIDSLLVLAKDWIERSDPCLLSINIYAGNITNVDQLQELIQLINQYSFRWMQLTYEGPISALSYFSSSAEGVSHLRTLILRNTGRNRASDGTFNLANHILQPTRLAMESIYLLKTVNIEWSLLTELEIDNTMFVPDCLEALRRAPHLTRCTLNPGLSPPEFMGPNHFPLPQSPIVHHTITSLTVIGQQFALLLAHLSCPSLKTFKAKHTNMLRRMRTPWIWMDPIVEFVQISGCPVTNFSLIGFEPSKEAIDSLCQGIPTLRHLYMKLADSSEILAHNHLLSLLATTTTVGKRKKPLYLPDLRSLTIHHNTDVSLDWTLLPAIFYSPRSSIRRRSKINSIEIRIGLAKASIDDLKIGKETQQQLLLLREQGVKLRLQVGKDRKDIMLIRLDRHVLNTNNT